MTEIEKIQHLEVVKDRQLAFKSEAMRVLACKILQRALVSDRVWPDEIDHSDIADEDKNCIGSPFRRLMNIGILGHGSDFRRSRADGARGRTVFVYHLLDRRLAEVFLKRNGVAIAPKQMEML